MALSPGSSVNTEEDLYGLVELKADKKITINNAKYRWVNEYFSKLESNENEDIPEFIPPLSKTEKATQKKRFLDSLHTLKSVKDRDSRLKHILQCTAQHDATNHRDRTHISKQFKTLEESEVQMSRSNSNIEVEGDRDGDSDSEEEVFIEPCTYCMAIGAKRCPLHHCTIHLIPNQIKKLPSFEIAPRIAWESTKPNISGYSHQASNSNTQQHFFMSFTEFKQRNLKSTLCMCPTHFWCKLCGTAVKTMLENKLVVHYDDKASGF